ncbi:MAG: Smr/MutS family protein [Polyangiaceae bacterium]|nr:Smr/MutS family protein [Polyangiaceae bacterium]
MPITESIDLHHFSPRDIPSVVEEYLIEAQRLGYREVRIIHGKGKGVQRQRVQKILSKHSAVESFKSDGLGSTLAVLKKS